MTDTTDEPRPGMSRRRLLGWTGAGAALAGVGAVAGYSAADTDPPPDPSGGVVPFRDVHQAGIITPAQDRLHFVALDLTTVDRAAIVSLLRRWTTAAERMTAGAEAAPGGAVNRNPEAPPSDTGEALGLPASALTITFGIGGSLLDKLGIPRPPELADLPPFQLDTLDPALSGGDLCLQACANDPQVAVHAVRNLVRTGFGTTSVRWSQLGFGRTSSTSAAQQTHRNLFGFKDGTNNLKAEDTALLEEQVWVPPAQGPAWLTGGTYLVARRIRMHVETWDRTSLAEQESLTGRTKGEGAPIGQAREFDIPNLGPGSPIAEDAHIRLASAQNNGGARILRRGYNFVDGSDGLGHLNAGLFFLAFMQDPRRQFVPMQSQLARNDKMMEYIRHTGSAVFAVPPGLREGAYWGQSLLEG
ncbi:iron uptake transporter deferrochelatase/peroxidase subunit [Actinomycetospora chibensis]|uniref:Deferrochelatase n=1 Tax=Actinomycetospora chibensis TaxID=663606 RepID=A0ABV9RL24_9PSEU|nr:iron uptake transporter deferrochelatase/peroxidase subunit [Actinomycetospora chibensis]MDD7923367.1 iron uptake transporter deferrochelatase/peroxidase subunit [Actinomycetospora chibensis]